MASPLKSDFASSQCHGPAVEAPFPGTGRQCSLISSEAFRKDPGGALETVQLDGRSVVIVRPNAEFLRNGKATHLAVLVPWSEYEQLVRLEKLRDALAAVQAQD
jgi:hypothetical protein